MSLIPLSSLKMDKSNNCGMCKANAVNPVRLPCGHVCCSTCYDKAVPIGQVMCPVCKKVCSATNLVTATAAPTGPTGPKGKDDNAPKVLGESAPKSPNPGTPGKPDANQPGQPPNPQPNPDPTTQNKDGSPSPNQERLRRFVQLCSQLCKSMLRIDPVAVVLAVLLVLSILVMVLLISTKLEHDKSDTMQVAMDTKEVKEKLAKDAQDQLDTLKADKMKEITELEEKWETAERDLKKREMESQKQLLSLWNELSDTKSDINRRIGDIYNDGQQDQSGDVDEPNSNHDELFM